MVAADLKKIRWTLALCFAILDASVGSIYVVAQWLSKEQMNKQVAQQTLSQARDQLSKVEDEREQLPKLKSGYLDLVESGVLGKFDRPQVADQFEAAIPSTLRSSVKSYKIGSQTQYTGKEVQTLSNYQTGRTPIEFEAEARHEQAVIDLVTPLTHMKGLVALEGCSIEGPDQSKEAEKAGLKLKCTLANYHFLPPNTLGSNGGGGSYGGGGGGSYGGAPGGGSPYGGPH